MIRLFTVHSVIAPRRPSATAGFTLVELMVTLGIVVLATTLVMVRYVSFNSSVLLNSLAYQVAFDLRETQSLAVSVRGSNAEFYEEYGLYFDMDDRNHYILFQDTNDSVRADPGPGYIQYDEGEEVGSPLIIDPRFTLVDICGTDMAGARVCFSETENFPRFVTIAFARPDFDAVIHGHNLGRLSSAELVFGASDDEAEITRAVVVTASGQITVK